MIGPCFRSTSSPLSGCRCCSPRGVTVFDSQEWERLLDPKSSPLRDLLSTHLRAGRRQLCVWLAAERTDGCIWSGTPSSGTLALMWTSAMRIYEAA